MLKKVQDRTEMVLRLNEDTRNSDSKLYLKYLNLFYGLKASLGDEAYYKLEHIIMNADGFESVTRCRRKLQEKGLYVGDNKRKEREQEFIEYSRT